MRLVECGIDVPRGFYGRSCYSKKKKKKKTPSIRGMYAGTCDIWPAFATLAPLY